MSPKSPVNFVQYHQHRLPEYPPLEVNYESLHTTSRSRTRKGQNIRTLDFEVGIRGDTLPSYSKAPPYHQCPEEDQWEDHGSGKQRERGQTKASIEVTPGTMHGDGPHLQMGVLDARRRRCEAIFPPSLSNESASLFVYSYADLRADFYDCNLLLPPLPLVCCQTSGEPNVF